MHITIYGKKKCGLCEAAKKKMELLDLGFVFRDLEDFDNWREDERGIVDAMVEYTLSDTLPVFRIDGAFMGYPAAMKLLKSA
jgi:glutaredoxin